MKLNFLFLLSLLFLSGTLAGQTVTVYSGTSYTGKSQSFGPGDIRMSELNKGVGNDKIKSIQVPAGWEVTVYEHDNYGGSKVTIKTSTTDLGVQSSTLSGKGSSLKIKASDSDHLTGSLVARWTFAGMSGPWDETENWQSLKFNGGAKLTHRGLELKKGAWAKVELEPTAKLPGEEINEKTLISWVILDDLSNNKPAGSVLTLDSKTRDQFDGIVFGEMGANTWSAGSNSFTRTQRATPQSPKSTATGEMIKMAVSYKAVGGKTEIKVYQNDALKMTYQKGALPTWKQNEIEVLFGTRHTIGNATKGFMDATIVAAEIHNKSLNAQEIAARKYTDPSSFIREAVSLQSVNYPKRYIVGADMLQNGEPQLLEINAGSKQKLKNQATITLVPGLADPKHVSLMLNIPTGAYIIAQSGAGPVRTLFPDGTNNFRKLATFKMVPGLAGSGHSFESLAHPGYYLRHSGFKMVLSKNDNSALFKKDASFNQVNAFVPEVSTEIPLSSDGWYLISNFYNSPGKVLGIKSDGKVGMMDLPKTGSIDHLLWRVGRWPQNLNDADNPNEWYLENKKQGSGKRLDSSKTGVYMANKGNLTGQIWDIRPIPWLGSDFFSLTNDYVGPDGKVLMCNKQGNPIMTNHNLDFVEQRWRFTFMHYANGVQRPELPADIKAANTGQNHAVYKNTYPKYGRALGIDYVATEGVSDWALHSARTVLTNVLLGLKDRSQIEKFKNYRILIVGDADKDIINYPDIGFKQANDWRGGTDNRVARITEEMMCRTGVTNRPGDKVYREYDQVVHEFGHTIDMRLGLESLIGQVQKMANTYPRDKQGKYKASYNAEQYPYWVQSWYNSDLVGGNNGKREGFIQNKHKAISTFMKQYFSTHREWRPFPVNRRYGK